MGSFQELFEMSKGGPVEYQGKQLQLLDIFPLEGSSRFRVVFEDSNAEWRQGILLRFNGRIRVNDQILTNSIILWQDTAPESVDFQVLSSPSFAIEVNNVWDIGDNVVHSWHNGAAMIVEPIPNGRRYHCNDGFDDDDFNDLVFRIERLIPNQS